MKERRKKEEGEKKILTKLVVGALCVLCFPTISRTASFSDTHTVCAGNELSRVCGMAVVGCVCLAALSACK
jgi:hypothetical protein